MMVPLKGFVQVRKKYENVARVMSVKSERLDKISGINMAHEESREQA